MKKFLTAFLTPNIMDTLNRLIWPSGAKIINAESRDTAIQLSKNYKDGIVKWIDDDYKEELFYRGNELGHVEIKERLPILAWVTKNYISGIDPIDKRRMIESKQYWDDVNNELGTNF